VTKLRCRYRRMNEKSLRDHGRTRRMRENSKRIVGWVFERGKNEDRCSVQSRYLFTRETSYSLFER